MPNLLFHWSLCNSNSLFNCLLFLLLDLVLKTRNRPPLDRLKVDVETHLIQVFDSTDRYAFFVIFDSNNLNLADHFFWLRKHALFHARFHALFFEQALL